MHDHTWCILTSAQGSCSLILICIRLRSVAVRMAQVLVRARSVPTQPSTPHDSRFTSSYPGSRALLLDPLARTLLHALCLCADNLPKVALRGECHSPCAGMRVGHSNVLLCDLPRPLLARCRATLFVQHLYAHRVANLQVQLQVGCVARPRWWPTQRYA